MALVHPPLTTDKRNKVALDVIAVPAIAADARKTWAGPGEEGNGWLDKLQSNLPSANVILYDHLEPEERQLEPKDSNDPASKIVAREYATTEASLAEYGVDDYANRLIRVVQQYRLFSGVRHPISSFLRPHTMDRAFYLPQNMFALFGDI
ncbi:MAG: hypothetical protein Q9195_006962 [Heterodermia aff. obscurata]